MSEAEKDTDGPIDVFQFTPDLLTGITPIDEDHKAWFEIAALLRDCSQDQAGTSIVASAISLVEEYVMGHFLREEKAMRAVNYPQYTKHRHQHARFRARVQAIAKVYHDGDEAAGGDLAKIVVNWLRNHILTEDKKYYHWVTSSSVDDRALICLIVEKDE